MVRSRIFGLLAIALFLPVCMCTSKKISKEDAMRSVEWTQHRTNAILLELIQDAEFAKKQIAKAEEYKNDVESAASEAKQNAEKYPEARTVANEVENAFSEFGQAYLYISKEGVNISTQLNANIPKVEALYQKAKNDYNVAPTSGDDYKEMKKKAEALKRIVKKMDKEKIYRFSLLSKVLEKEVYGLVPSWRKAVMANSHVACIAAVSKTEIMLKEAETHIAVMDKSKVEIDATVKELHKLYAKAPANLKDHIHTLYSTTEAELKAVTSAIAKTKEAHQEILKKQKEAADALEKVKTANTIEEAKRNAGIATAAASEIERKAEAIKKVVETVKTYSSNALSRKQSAEESIKKREVVPVRKETVTPNHTGTEKPHQSLEESKESPSRKGEEQETENNQGTMEIGTPEQSMNKPSDKPISGKSDQPKNETAGAPIMEKLKQTVQGRIMPSASVGKDVTQRFSSHNGELGDSAVTASISLLIALIACAAMH